MHHSCTDAMKGFAAHLDALCARTMCGDALSRDELLRLLDLDPDSPQCGIMREKARNMARSVCGNTGRVWSAVGIEHRSCSMNCQFCSFGEKWGLVRDAYEWPDEDVVRAARLSVTGGASWFILRTTEHYSLERLCALARTVRARVPGNWWLVANTGELDVERARQLREAGVSGVYHTLRLGEGRTTRIAPEVRLSTMRAVVDAGLRLYHLIEPLGPEHGNEEIVERLIASRACNASMGGVMARVNVNGTPFAGREPVSEARVCQVVAVSRICGGVSTPDVCVVPPNRRALQSGANAVTVEVGAVPRSERIEHSAAWNGFGVREAFELLRSADYDVGTRA